MPPKKKGGKKKSSKPEWMSPELYDLSLNLPKLQEFWCGELKEPKGKDKDKPQIIISKTQAGLFILQLLFPNNKQGKAKRQESIKLGVVETSVQVIRSQKPNDMVSAASILAVMLDTFDQCRQIITDLKLPPLIPHVLNGLRDHDSAPLKAALCSFMRELTKFEDTRMRLWRYLKEWDWLPLIQCLCLQDVSQLGGRNAAHDALVVLDSFCSHPKGDIGNSACTAVVKTGGIKAIVKVLQDRVSHPLARAAGLSVLNQIMRRSSVATCEEVLIDAGGLGPIVMLLEHTVIPLINKAHAAAVLLRYIMPDVLWADASSLNGRPKAAASAQAAAAAAAASDPSGTPPPMPSIADASMAAPPSPDATGKLGAKDNTDGPREKVVVPYEVGKERMDALKIQVSHGIESRPGTSQTQRTGIGNAQRPGSSAGADASHLEGAAEPAVPDDYLLDAETKADIAKRARVVGEAGALPSLVKLCAGPEGPLVDLEVPEERREEAAEAARLLAKRSKKTKGKKKVKMEPGMAEAQTWSSAVIRMISLDAAWGVAVRDAGAIRYLLPLLDSKIHPARWNARQTLINLSMNPDLLPSLQLYNVPNFIHGANVPKHHFDRPFPSTGIVEEELMQLPAHLAGPAAAAQRDISMGAHMNTTTGNKAPPLKSAAAAARARAAQEATLGKSGEVQKGAAAEVQRGVPAEAPKPNPVAEPTAA